VTPREEGVRPVRAGSGREDAGDGWSAMSHLMAGVLLWGGLGWLASWWTGVPAFTGGGIVVGAALGIVLVYLRYGKPRSQPGTAGRDVPDPVREAPPQDGEARPQHPSRAQEEER